MLRLIMWVTVLLLAACGSSGNSDDENALHNPIDMGDTHLLLWRADGTAPGQQNNPGDIVMMNQRSELETLVELPAGTMRVHACGNAATSPDGRYFGFFAGGAESGTLYIAKGTDNPEAAAQVHSMSCMSGGSFQFSPDSEQFGYINFAPGAAGADFAAGTLHIADSDNLEARGEFNDVVAFDYAVETLGFIGFFAGNNGQAAEAGIFQWTGGTPTEITTVFPDSGCRFRSADLAATNDESMMVILGQSCGTNHSWVLYTIDTINRRASLVNEGTTGQNGAAGHWANVRTTSVYAAPNGEAVFYSYPNGVARQIADWQSALLADIQPGDPFIRYSVMPHAEVQPYSAGDNATPVLSPDGRWAALVTSSPGSPSQAALNVIDLNAPDLPPITLSAGNPGDTVSSMAFTQDSTRLLFVAGGHSSGSNSLFSLDLSTATDTRLIRGRYAPGLIISPDGTKAALLEWQIPTEAGRANSLNLVVINLEDNQMGTLFAGIHLTDGRVTEQRFAYPLSWRR